MTATVNSVRIMQVTDSDPDTSLLGEYMSSPPSNMIPHGRILYAEKGGVPWWAIIDRKVRGDWYGNRNEARFYVGPWENYEGTKPELARKYIGQDYERAEAYNRGEWWYVGVYAQAELSVKAEDGWPITQVIRSAGLWGIESDAGQSWFDEFAEEELDQLRAQLAELGIHDLPATKGA